ncbi:MAG: hypothetical protein AAF363_22220 [Bacteroidota bacterium]
MRLCVMYLFGLIVFFSCKKSKVVSNTIDYKTTRRIIQDDSENVILKDGGLSKGAIRVEGKVLDLGLSNKLIQIEIINVIALGETPLSAAPKKGDILNLNKSSAIEFSVGGNYLLEVLLDPSGSNKGRIMKVL